MKRAVTLTVLAAALWLVGGTWYYDCKIKRVCGPDESPVPARSSPVARLADAPAASRAAAPAAEAAAEQPPAPGAAMPPPAGQAASGRPEVVLMVSFDARSAALQPPADASQRLEVLRRGVAEGKKILVLGHSDGSGARVRIGVVSQQRAEALRDWLLAEGIDPAAIAAVESREDRDPIASNTRAEGRARNRRAEALLVPSP